MQETVTNVLGIEIPSTSPLFLAIVGVHVVVGIAAVICGAVAILQPACNGHWGCGNEGFFWRDRDSIELT